MINHNVLTKTQVAYTTILLSSVISILFFGLLSGVIFTLLLFMYGFVIGYACAVVSPVVGVVTGLILIPLTLSRHYPLKDANKYKIMVSSVTALVYMIGGLISTAPIVLIMEADPYRNVILYKGEYIWNYTRLAYAEDINGDIYNVPGALLLGIVGIYAGGVISKWYVMACGKAEG